MSLGDPSLRAYVHLHVLDEIVDESGVGKVGDDDLHSGSARASAPSLAKKTYGAPSPPHLFGAFQRSHQTRQPPSRAKLNHSLAFSFDA